MNKSTYSPKEQWPFVNYLDTGNITDNRIDDIKYIKPKSAKLPSRARRKVQPGEIVFSMVAPNQRHFGLLRDVPENFLVSTGFAVISAREKLANTGFIYWFLSQDHIVKYLHTLAEQSQSVFPSIRPDDIKNLEINLPPLTEQRAIAHILSTLDDKIALNHRVNQTLENITRAIFKDWFVDFGPVRAKLEGSYPYLPSEIWRLFPGRFVNSRLGEIPEGWKVGKVEDEFEIIMGQSPPGHTYNEIGEGLPFFQGSSDFGFRYPKNRKFCTAPNRIAEPWDTIVSVRAPVGDINMAWERCCIGRGIAALRPRSGTVSYGQCVAQGLQIRMRKYEHTGTVFGAIKRKQIEQLPLSLPDPDVARGFEYLVNPMDKMIRSLTAEIDTLTALREALLPKLISGAARLRVA